jgi:hypothetical protein
MGKINRDGRVLAVPLRKIFFDRRIVFAAEID